MRRSVDQLGESAEIESRAVLPQGVEFIAEFRSQPVEEAGAVRNLRPEPGYIAELIAKLEGSGKHLERLTLATLAGDEGRHPLDGRRECAQVSSFPGEPGRSREALE